MSYSRNGFFYNAWRIGFCWYHQLGTVYTVKWTVYAKAKVDSCMIDDDVFGQVPRYPLIQCGGSRSLARLRTPSKDMLSLLILTGGYVPTDSVKIYIVVGLLSLIPLIHRDQSMHKSPWRLKSTFVSNNMNLSECSLL
jgi:hypothetical protein